VGLAQHGRDVDRHVEHRRQVGGGLVLGVDREFGRQRLVFEFVELHSVFGHGVSLRFRE
jgi:hypothetical protein